MRKVQTLVAHDSPKCALVSGCGRQDLSAGLQEFKTKFGPLLHVLCLMVVSLQHSVRYVYSLGADASNS